MIDSGSSEEPRSEYYRVGRRPVSTLIWALAVALVLGTSIAVAAHALLYKRDPRAQLSWVLTILLIPILGVIAYVIFGVNRIRRRAAPKRSSQLPPHVVPATLQDPAGVAELRATGAERLGALPSYCDRLTRRPLVTGNELQMLHNGEAVFPQMLEMIEGAERSVTLCTYIFDGDDTGRAFADALRRAQHRGVKVRILVDAIGEKYSTVSIFHWLTGMRAARFNPVRIFGKAAAYLNLRNHRKILVVDGRAGFAGGMNIGDRHLAGRTENEERVRDLHFRVEGPIVGQLQQTFAEDWLYTTGEVLEGPDWFPVLEASGPALARVITDGPDEEFEKLHWILMGAFSCARRKIWIMTPYFIPTRTMIAALATAALRGVDVALVLPAKNNLRFVQWASTAYLWELLQHGVRIYLQPPPFTHTKLLMVDDVWSLLGSSNLDPRSLRLNFEMNVEVYEPALAELIGAHFTATIARSTPVTQADLDAQPLGHRLRNALAKLFSPYL